jgi:hypothetical protein
MTVTARLRCSHIAQSDNCVTVYFHAVYSDDKSSPNYSFSQSTPNANLTMSITNPAAYGQFEGGKEYDLAFTPTLNP